MSSGRGVCKRGGDGERGGWVVGIATRFAGAAGRRGMASIEGTLARGRVFPCFRLSVQSLSVPGALLP